jgi:phosphoserine aminotransferase
MHARSLARSTPIYNYIDASHGYYVNRVAPKYRSRINITFRICDNAELEAKFVSEA